MARFSTRLALMFMLLAGVSILGSGFFMYGIVVNAHVETAMAAMERELALISRDLAALDAGPASDPVLRREALSRYAAETDRLLDARITIIGTDGTVLADSRTDPDDMENHGSREEILQAKAEGIGFARRQSVSLGIGLLYAAVPFSPEGSDEPAGYVRIAVGMDTLETTKRRLLHGLAAWMLLFAAIAFAASYRIARSLSRPLERIARAARSISRQDPAAAPETRIRVSEDGRDEFAQLGRTINAMADSLRERMEAARESEKRLASVLDEMISGVMLVDPTGIVRLANRKAVQWFGLAAGDVIGRPFGEIGGPAELAGLIRSCLAHREHLREELTMRHPDERTGERIIEANLVPIGAGDAQDGIVIVLHDITDIRRLERMRSQFVANVSHELRTPVAAIRGYAETLMAGALHDPETAESFLKIIADESRRLGRLIEDILDLSNIESKQVAMHFAPVDLAGFIAKTMGTVQPAADEKRIRLAWDVEDGLHIEADEDKLGQILLNLLSNAIAYTPEGGSVTVTARTVASAGGAGGGTERAGSGMERTGSGMGGTEGGMDRTSAMPGGAAAHPADGDGGEERVRIEVRDTGIGIPRKDLPRIFERFYRVDKARSRSSGGTGLGLSIVKHLVELHHGSISVESEPGAGSVFAVELPVLQPWNGDH